MSDVGKTEAQVPVTEAVVETTPAVVETKVEKIEDPEVEMSETPVEGAEVVETEEEKKTKSAKKREKIKARVEALEAENQRLAEQLRAAERNKPAAAELGPEPDPATFDSDAKYTAALAAWTVEKTFIARQTKAHEANTATARANAAEAGVNLFRERAMALTDLYPDIEAKVFKDQTLPMSQVMADTLMGSEKGPEVAYYLSANREEAQRIKEMQPLAAAAALGRLEAKLSLPKPRTETKAPPPPSTLNGTVKGPGKNPEDMTQAEYVAWRKKGGGEKRTG